MGERRLGSTAENPDQVCSSSQRFNMLVLAQGPEVAGRSGAISVPAFLLGSWQLLRCLDSEYRS